MLNPSQLLAIANADAHTSNAGLPSYSDLLRIAQNATAVALWYAPNTRCADYVTVERCHAALAVFAAKD